MLLLTFYSCKNEKKKSVHSNHTTEQYQLDIIGKDNFKISLIQDIKANKKLNENWKIIVLHKNNKAIKKPSKAIYLLGFKMWSRRGLSRLSKSLARHKLLTPH